MSDKPRRVFAVKRLLERKQFPAGTGAARSILIALAWFAQDDGTSAWPSHATLAARTAYSRANVVANLQLSVARGWIRVTGKRVVDVRTTVSVYAFDLAKFRALPDLKKPATVSDADTVRAATVSANGADGVSDRGFTVSDADTKVSTLKSQNKGSSRTHARDYDDDDIF